MPNQVESTKLDDARQRVIKYYESYRSQIQHEDILLNQRVTWTVTSQAFLLGTYAFLVNSPLFYIIRNSDVPAEIPGSKIPFDKFDFINSVAQLKQVFQWIGLSSSLFTLASAIAAILAIMRLTKSYGPYLLSQSKSEEEIKRMSPKVMANEVAGLHREVGLPPLVTKRLLRVLGLASSIFFGMAFAAAWAYLLLESRNITLNVSLPVVYILLGVFVISVIWLLLKLSDWGTTE